MPGIQECPGAPARPPSPGGRVEGHGVRGFGAPVRLEICPTVVYNGGDALQWIMLRRGMSWLGHYVDDFITMGAAGRSECESNLFQTSQP